MRQAVAVASQVLLPSTAPPLQEEEEEEEEEEGAQQQQEDEEEVQRRRQAVRERCAAACCLPARGGCPLPCALPQLRGDERARTRPCDGGLPKRGKLSMGAREEEMTEEEQTVLRGTCLYRLRD